MALASAAPAGRPGSTLPRPRRVAGGVVAHNDEGRVARSVRSLLEQRLPSGYEWSRIWIVASGCTDRTVEICEELARADTRIELVVEPERRGKAAAIHQILRRAEGESLVLLNSDAVALPGAVSTLLSRAEGRRAPYAVMARPIVTIEDGGSWTDAMRWMWELHHELHLQLLSEGRGAHLSDELLLLSLPHPAPLREGIINDGSFLAVWLSLNEGGCWYAPESLVSVVVPRTASDFVRQHRRIHFGDAQVRGLLGRAPTTFPRYLAEHPARAMRALRSALGRPRGVRHLLHLGGWEVVSHLLALWDRLPPRADHVHWRRIRSSASEPTHGGVRTSDRLEDPAERVERKVDSLLSVAANFRTGVDLGDLASLLPSEAPLTASDLARFLQERPELARVQDERAFHPGITGVESADRKALGEAHWKAANRLVLGPLGFAQRWIRCLGISGSVAYGEPEPGDDLDLFIVTRAGSTWWFLAMAFLVLRIRRLKGEDRGAPALCVNYVLDDRRALSEFESARGYLFAREALTVRAVIGDGYLQGLLLRAPWMEKEIPRLYADRTRNPASCEPLGAPGPIRIANALVFLPLTAYLQLVGLRRSRRTRGDAFGHGPFRTITQRGRFVLATDRFERLRERYGEVDPSPDRADDRPYARLPASPAHRPERR